MKFGSIREFIIPKADMLKYEADFYRLFDTFYYYRNDLESLKWASKTDC